MSESAIKSVFPNRPQFTAHSDGTRSQEERVYVQGITGDSEAARCQSAIEKAGKGKPPDMHPDLELAVKGVRMLQADVQLLQDEKALVIFQWGVPTEPSLDGDWVYESGSESVREVVGLDVKGNPITLEYVPPFIDDSQKYVEFFGITGNEVEFRRGLTVGGLHSLVNVTARRQVSFEIASNFAIPIGKWPLRYTNYVNEALAAGQGTSSLPGGGGGGLAGDDEGMTAGTWLCKSVRFYTRNNGQSYFVEAAFAFNSRGWEEFAFFTNRRGLKPGNIVIPDAMKAPWPADAAARKCSADGTWDAAHPRKGVIRPQTIKGLRNFGEMPFNLNLVGFA